MTDRKISEKATTAQKVQKEGVTPPRRPGRPSGVKKGVDKRELLLDAALKLFAQSGIAETPLSMIAKEAGVTTAMLHYYFNTREQLLEKVWGFDYFGDSRTVDVHVKRLREKLTDCEELGWSIKTVWSVGYKFEVK